ncbi:hypothetical protein [Bizionia arctica]|uniref:Proteinase inhibitor I42 chagasin domain-containing protein n=1 Tax=Bizionia arctica TaxID=1495645 RepID=A0A917GKJ1_9FLAO|nr:hypothetical protein [Bizionia arctica]GGG49367.1 hypothetical protein GCM10010976_20850 [Bizionia arctica]
MKKANYLILCTSLLLFVACSGPYTYKDNGSIIELTEDDPFDIQLISDVGSDYTWQLESTLEFTKLLDTETIKNSDNTIDYHFNFKTISDGEEFIRFNLTDGSDIKNTFEIKVIVGSIGLITSD